MPPQWLANYPHLLAVTILIDRYLQETYPDFFKSTPRHPALTLKPHKDIHDQIWGTNRFSWRELSLLDTPIFQRLRNIHQTGLAYYVYPSAQHSRFEHSLGVVTVATRVFDAIAQRHADVLETIASDLGQGRPVSQTVSRLRQELRLAALLHDTGHSLFSHASERVYSKLEPLRNAVNELSAFLGKEKGAGEVLSFCIANTTAVSNVLANARTKLQMQRRAAAEDIQADIDLDNVALLIVGLAKHPQLQFMGDIISSGFDADKLDYLLRDAAAAGLPLRYDLERYLSTVFLRAERLYDFTGKLRQLYPVVGTDISPSDAAPPHRPFPYFETYRLRLPKRAMNTIEQIAICKLMLFSYIYHHQKVRAAEGFLERLLQKWSNLRRAAGVEPEQILIEFLGLTDGALFASNFLGSSYTEISEPSYKLANRLVPRVVYEFTPAATHSAGRLIRRFILDLGDEDNGKQLINDVETAIGTELLKLVPGLAPSPEEALYKAGVWLDYPKAPRFEGMEELVGSGEDDSNERISDIFPIGRWIEAYENHRFYVRIYALSEYRDQVAAAARTALEIFTGIKSDDFYKSSKRSRD